MLTKGTKTYVTQSGANFRQLSFLDDYLIEFDGAIIAGGCFKNLLQQERAKDLDIFFRTVEDFIMAVTKIKNLVNSDSNWQQSYSNDKVVAFNDVKNNFRLELNRSEFGDPEKLLRSFDFTITKFAYYAKENKTSSGIDFEVMYHKDFFEHLLLKRLVLDDKIPFPIATFNRSYRYNSYGYGLCRESKIKLLTAINELGEIDEDELGKSLYNGRD